MPSHPCSVLMIDTLIKILKKKVGCEVEIIYYMDDLKTSRACVEKAKQVHEMGKRYADSVGMVINNKKSAIQMSGNTRLRVSPGDSQSGRDNVQVSRL